MNERVSLWGENFSCEGESQFIANLFDVITKERVSFDDGSYGVSKKEDLVSDFYGADGRRRAIGV